MVDDEAFRTHLKRFYTKRGINYRTVLNAGPKLLQLMENLTDAFEMSTRLGEYKLAREAGAHPRHAAYSAREVSTDFAMRGDSQVLGFFYDSVMFLKAGINSIDREYRGVRHDPNAIKIAAGTGVVALTSMALFALNRDNPLYDELEDWDKDLHWHFFVPDGDGGYQHFRYPKPWTVGGIASIAERTLDQMLAGSVRDNRELARGVMHIVTDLFQLNFMPQILAPLYEQATNKTGISQRPIETPSMQTMKPYARANVYTSRTMTDVGLATRGLPRRLQVSPARAEALLQVYFNTWALYGLSLSDAALYDDKPEMSLDQYPVFRRFYQGQPHRHTKYETTFYDMLKEATELRLTMRHMDSIGRPDVASELEADPAIERYRQVTRANDDLTGIRNEMQAVYRDTALTPKEKRARLDTLTGEKNTLLQAVVEDIQAQEATVE